MMIEEALRILKAVCKKEIHLLANSSFFSFFLFLYFTFSALVIIAAGSIWKGNERIFLLLGILPLLQVLFLPIVGIRFMQTEIQASGWKLLFSFPLNIEAVIFGKILIAGLFSCIPTLGNLLLAAVLVPSGEMTFSLFIVQCLLFFFLNFLIIAISVFFASLIHKRILSYLSAIASIFVTLYLPFPFFRFLYPYSGNAAPYRFIDRLAVFNLEAVSVSDLLFFSAISTAIYFLTVNVWEKKRKGGSF